MTPTPVAFTACHAQVDFRSLGLRPENCQLHPDQNALSCELLSERLGPHHALGVHAEGERRDRWIRWGEDLAAEMVELEICDTWDNPEDENASLSVLFTGHPGPHDDCQYHWYA